MNQRCNQSMQRNVLYRQAYNSTFCQIIRFVLCLGLMIQLRINELLEQRGRTAYWLAVETGTNHAVIAKLRHNRAKSIRFDVLERLCNALECEPSELIQIVEDKPKETGKTKRKGNVARSGRKA